MPNHHSNKQALVTDPYTDITYDFAPLFRYFKELGGATPRTVSRQLALAADNMPNFLGKDGYLYFLVEFQSAHTLMKELRDTFEEVKVLEHSA